MPQNGDLRRASLLQRLGDLHAGLCADFVDALEGRCMAALLPAKTRPLLRLVRLQDIDDCDGGAGWARQCAAKFDRTDGAFGVADRDEDSQFAVGDGRPALARNDNGDRVGKTGHETRHPAGKAAAFRTDRIDADKKQVVPLVCAVLQDVPDFRTVPMAGGDVDAIGPSALVVVAFRLKGAFPQSGGEGLGLLPQIGAGDILRFLGGGTFFLAVFHVQNCQRRCARLCEIRREAAGKFSAR